MVDLVQQYDTEAETNNFDDLPHGKYEAQIVESGREPISKDKDLGECLNLCWQIVSGPFENRMMWQRINLWWTGPEKEPGKVVQISNTQFADVRKATGKKVVNASEELHYIPCRVTYGPQKSNPQYSEVKYVAAAGGQPARQIGQDRPPAHPPAHQAAAANQGAAAKPSPWPRRA